MQLIQLKQIVDLRNEIRKHAIPAARSTLPVYQTGDQLVSGKKEFVGRLNVTGQGDTEGEAGFYVGEGDIDYDCAIFSGNVGFNRDVRIEGNSYLSGQLWITGYAPDNDQGGILVDQGRWYNVNQPYLIYNTGYQEFLGPKINTQGITGYTDLLLSGNSYITGDAYFDKYIYSNGHPYTSTICSKTPEEKYEDKIMMPMLSGEGVYEDIVMPYCLLPKADPQFRGKLWMLQTGILSGQFTDFDRPGTPHSSRRPIETGNFIMISEGPYDGPPPNPFA